MPPILPSTHTLHSEIDLNNPQAFFKTALSRYNVVTIVYTLVCGYFAGAYIATIFRDGSTGAALYLGTLAIVPATLLLLPLHEALHALAYWVCGARDIRFGWVPRQFMVYAAAHHFVANSRQFVFVAILPFAVITAGLLVAKSMWPAYTLLWYGVLMLHTVGCMGDAALLGYYYDHRQRGLLTYDDLAEKKSYFFSTH